MAFRLPYIKPFLRAADCSLMILSYRGYGESEGRPSERGLQMDAQVRWPAAWPAGALGLLHGDALLRTWRLAGLA